jgi:hypothetical protein
MATPDLVNSYSKPTEEFLCPLSANRFNIEFLAFRIRDIENGQTLFEVDRDKPDLTDFESGAVAHPPEDADHETQQRTIQYEFPRRFLKLKTIGTMLTFSVGAQAVPNLRMIERHYFKNKLIKSFDFKTGFCIPNSTNTWEAIYDVPQLSAAEEDEIVQHPYETKSDSFYFVNEELVMHNKAEYMYRPE